MSFLRRIFGSAPHADAQPEGKPENARVETPPPSREAALLALLEKPGISRRERAEAADALAVLGWKCSDPYLAFIIRLARNQTQELGIPDAALIMRAHRGGILYRSELLSLLEKLPLQDPTNISTLIEVLEYAFQAHNENLVRTAAQVWLIKVGKKTPEPVLDAVNKCLERAIRASDEELQGAALTVLSAISGDKSQA